MISSLLRKNISKWQLAAYSSACFVGLTILLTSLCFYRDISAAHQSSSNSGYIVLSKPVPLLAALNPGNSAASTFTRSEIDDLISQPWARQVGEFTPADFNISASVDFAGRGLSTALFFEALPDRFIDIDLDPDVWSFSEGHTSIPIIVPRDYLSLYNFGFAASRGMPQVSEELVMQIPLRIAMSGNGFYDVMPARIVGLSSRINTIAVPESFMSWANERYSEKHPSQHHPSRLIVELVTPGDPAIDKWLSDNDIEASHDGSASDRTVFVATIISSVVGIIGIIIAALAVMLLLVSLFLLIQKNSDKIRDLTLLGYRRSKVGEFYYKLVITINTIITIGASAATIFASHLWQKPLEAIGSEPSDRWTVVISAFVVMGVVTAVSVAACRRMINSVSR